MSWLRQTKRTGILLFNFIHSLGSFIGSILERSMS